jgi:Bacterial Ig domain/Bacterial cadherin-like domain
MTRSHAGAQRGRTRRRHRIASITGLVALLGAALVTVAAPAHAFSPCADPNFCPVANDDNYTVAFATTLKVDAAQGLLANDLGTPGTHVLTDSFDTSNVSDFGNATVHVNADGSFTYTPNPTAFGGPFSGDDSFEYTIANTGDTSEDFATVYIHVPGIARNDTYGTGINHTLTVPDPGVFANDTGLDPTSVDIPFNSLHGSLSDDGNGGFVYTPNTGFIGTDSFQYSAWDYDSDNIYSATVTIFVDGTPPTASMLPLPPVTLSTTVVPKWSGTDDQGIANYDTQYQIAAWNAGFGPWTAWRSATTATSAPFTGTYGRTFCFRARARDHAGNVSPFTAPRCTSVPLRARSLVYSSRWIRQANAAFFSGEAFNTIYKGQTAIRTFIQAKRMWLVASKCAACGTLQVRWNNVVLGNVNLASPTTVHHALIPIAAFTTPRAGTLQLYVTSPNGKLVIIEGLAILRV